MSVPALNDYEYQFEDTGVLLNPTAAGSSATLPFIDITKVSGLDSPEFRTSTHDHEGVDGGYVDSEFYTTRTIVLEGTLYADPADADTICDQLRYNYRPMSSASPFYFKHPGKDARVVFGKGQGARYDIENLRRTGQTALQLTIVCPDPYVYDAAIIQVTGTSEGVDPGHGFNHGFNHGFGGAGTSDNQVTIFNAGNHRAYPVIEVFGPVSSPVVVESRTGFSVGFDVEIAKNDSLVIDMLKHTAIQSGVINRRSKLVAGSKWWYVDPGSSTITMTGTALVSAGVFTATTGGTTQTILGADADASDIAIGDRFRIYDSTNVLKEVTVFEIIGLSSTAGTTTATFTPPAQAATASGDYIKAGVAAYTVSMYSTWY